MRASDSGKSAWNNGPQLSRGPTNRDERHEGVVQFAGGCKGKFLLERVHAGATDLCVLADVTPDTPMPPTILPPRTMSVSADL